MSDPKKPTEQRALARAYPDGDERPYLDATVLHHIIFRVPRMASYRKNDGISIGWISEELADEKGSYLVVDTVSRRVVAKVRANHVFQTLGHKLSLGQKYVLVPLGLA